MIDPQLTRLLQMTHDENGLFVPEGDRAEDIPGLSRAVERGLIRRISAGGWDTGERYDLTGAGRVEIGLPRSKFAALFQFLRISA